MDSCLRQPKCRLSGARYAVYDIISTAPGKPLSHNQILMRTGYSSRETIRQAIIWLTKNGYISRNGNGNGTACCYTPNGGANVLDT